MKFSKSNIRKAVIIGVIQTIVLLLLFLVCFRYIKQVIFDNQQKNQAELNPWINDVGLTKIDWTRVRSATPEPITAGVYLDRISDFDIVHSKWSYEFDLWFRWNPKQVKFINMKDTIRGAISGQNSPVRVVNGDIEHIETDSFYLNSKGDSAYILFHISATSTKFFNVSEYPLDNYLLTIEVESVSDDLKTIAFIPDSANSNVSSRVSVNGFEKDAFFILAKPHTIKSSLGDPRKTAATHNTYSQLRLALFIKRGGFAIYIKTFITLYIAVLLGFLSFFAADNDKIRVIVGSLFFAAATLNIILTRIPSTPAISVAEIVNNISLITILLIAARETAIKFLFKNNKEVDYLNKWITFGILFIFYMAINITIPLMCIHALM